MLKLLITLCLLFETSAWSQECATKDLNAGLRAVPDQSWTGWCFAFTLADLYSKKLGVKVSATDIAISNHHFLFKDKIPWRTYFYTLDANPPLGNSTEDVKLALETIGKAGGVCPEAIIKSNSFDVFESKDLYKVLKTARGASSDHGLVCTTESTAARSIFQNLTDAKIGEIVGKSFDQHDWFRLAQESCKGERKPVAGIQFLEQHGKNATERQALMKSMDEQLDNDNIVGIKYTPSIVYNLGVLSAYSRASTKLTGTSPDPVHASSIVGRRKNPETGRCEYRIRNSYGTSCDWESHERCSEGLTWVDSEALKSSLGSVYYLK